VPLALPNRSLAAALLVLAALWLASCAVPLGPVYTVEKQSIAVRFVPGAEPRVEIRGDYLLRNTGKQPLDGFELRLPRGSVVRLEAVSTAWDGQAGLFEPSRDADGDILRLKLSAPWPLKQKHALHIEYDIVRGTPNTPQLDLAADGFYLPPDQWLAVLLPSHGAFGRGGIPPKEWTLTVRAPADFLVHASGESKRPKRQSRDALEFSQRTPGLAAFVVGGRYFQQEYRGATTTVYVWKKNKFDKPEAQPLADAVHEIARTYEAMFGPRDKIPRSIWIADSPLPANRYGFVTPAGLGEVGGLPPAPSFAFIPMAASEKEVPSQGGDLREIARSLAWSWSGFGLNPGYQDQPEPLRSLPLYAASVALEAIEGPQGRTRMIQESLAEYDAKQSSRPTVVQEGSKKEVAVFTDGFANPLKTLLFYSALEDRFGRANLHKALRYMVQARRGRGYDLNDLIAALEKETKQNAAEFVRLWRKHPGIPGEFRARYLNQPAPAATSSKEINP
jgi:hypothetical protein